MKGVQCYDLFGGIALKNHAFSFNSLSVHLFADDTQIETYILPYHVHSAISTVEACISDLKCWMIENKLQLNDEKNGIFSYTLK